MKLFSFKDKKKRSDFVFVVCDVFALIHGGVVIAGQVTEGTLCQGEQAVCIPGAGKPFLCVIEAIEQPDPGRPSERSESGRPLWRKLCAENFGPKQI
jgi:translation elongation factor EF-Tu-like GTPase